MENSINYDVQDSEQQIHLRDYLNIIYQGRWIVLVCFLTVLSAAAYFTFTANPVFQASSKVLVDDQASMERALFNVNYMNNSSTLLAQQIEILKSRRLAENVIPKLEAKPYRDSLYVFQPLSNGGYFVFEDQVSWLRSQMAINPMLEADIIEITFSAGTAFESAEICNVITETFQQLNKEYNRSEFRDLREFLELQLRKKGEELRKSEETLRLYKETEKLVSLDASTAELIRKLAVSQAAGETAQIELQSAQEQKRSLEAQLEERRGALSSEVSEISSPLLNELQQNYAKLVSDKVRYESLIAQDKNIDPREYELQLQSMNSRISAVKSRLQEEAQRISTTSMVSDPLKIAEDLVASILDFENQINGLSAKIDAYRDVVQQNEIVLDQLPSQGLELVRLERQVKVDENTFVLLTQKLEETKIAEAGQKEIIRVIDTAIEPVNPISPKKRLNLLLGAILGLGLGIGLTFLKEFFDDSVKSPEEIEKIGLQILSIIPEISADQFVKKASTSNGHESIAGQENVEARLITHFDPKSPISEAYRTLRTNIQFQKFENECPALLVTSSTPKEGKSTTIANLAITMAQMGSRTLIVDTDLRRPVIHSVFGLRKEKGVSNFLLGKMSFDEITKPTIIDNLYAITSGPLPPNPSEMIASDEMDDFIRVAREKFDVVLFDSPPIIAVTDAAIMSAKIDGLLLVVRAHQTQKHAVRHAKTLLENVESNILGCLLNGVSAKRSYGSYYYYYQYQYYSYYGHDLKRRKKSKSK
ncbi:MAG: polysaccharide biosynthesis tyrosine autokinase [Calditrichia bacterium]